jgi:hypothetical protein
MNLLVLMKKIGITISVLVNVVVLIVGVWHKIPPKADVSSGGVGGDVTRGVLARIDQSHSLSPQAQIYVQSVMLRSIEVRARIESLNQAIQPAIEGEAVWFDLYPIFLASDGLIKDVI